MRRSGYGPACLFTLFGLMVVLACAPSGAPAQPTAAAPVATSAVAAASPVATSVAAAVSPVATAVSPVAAAASPAAATAVAASPVRITGAQVTPSDATVTVQNSGTAAADLSGWKLWVGTVTATLPGNTNVPPGDTVTIHTASGTSAGKDVYLGQDATALMSALQ